MRYLPGRPPITPKQRQEAVAIVNATVNFLIHVQSRLFREYGDGCFLQVCWENPSAARHLGLMAFLEEKGYFQKLRKAGIDMEVWKLHSVCLALTTANPHT